MQYSKMYIVSLQTNQPPVPTSDLHVRCIYCVPVSASFISAWL